MDRVASSIDILVVTDLNEQTALRKVNGVAQSNNVKIKKSDENNLIDRDFDIILLDIANSEKQAVDALEKTIRKEAPRTPISNIEDHDKTEFSCKVASLKKQLHRTLSDERPTGRHAYSPDTTQRVLNILRDALDFIRG